MILRRLSLTFLVVSIGASGALTAQAAHPRAGSTLTIGWYQEPDSLNPAKTGARSVSQILRSVVDTLVWLTTSGKITPDLATSWHVSKDARTYTFMLRKGVKFQDGTPFNAQAVVDNFNYIMNPATKSQSALGALGPFKAARALGKYEVQVTFSQPYAPFLPRLGEPVLGMQSPAGIAKEEQDPSALPITSGPYQIVSFTPNSSIVLQRNPNYNWNPPALHHSGPASIDKIVFTISETAQARLDELQSGQAQLINGVPGVYFKQFKGSGDFAELSLPLSGVGIWAVMNNTKFPTNSKAVRQAILYYTNRAAVVKLADDNAFPLTWGPIQKGTIGYSPQFNGMYRYNPTKAAAILTKAGWKKVNGIWTKYGRQLTVDLTSIASNADYPALAQAIQADLTTAGMKTSFEQLAITAWEDNNTKGGENITPLQWTDVDPDALRVLFTPGQFFNWCNYNNPVFTRIVYQAAALGSIKARLKLYYRAEKLLMDDAVMMPLHYNADLVLMAKSLHGLQTAPQGGLVFVTASLS